MSKEQELIAECNLEFSDFYVEWRCRCGSPEARWSGAGVFVRPLHAAHVVSKLSENGYSIVRTTNPMGKCQDKFPLSDPALLCQRDSGHAGAHEALDASCDRFRWPNLAAAAAAEEDQ